MTTVVAALYRFVRLEDFESLRDPLRKIMLEHEVRGTLLLAPEGLNGTIAGSRQGTDAVLAWLRSDPRFAGLEAKESLSESNPFYRTRVKLKREIVTMGVEDIDPNDIVGTYVKPSDWNDLISDPEVTVIDTRNQYETRIGSFKNAVDPGTETFREFPAYAADKLDPEKHPRIAMYCTGGIRCEKSTAYLKQQGFREVYHLEGGILKYLEEVAPDESLWEGQCFVFDNRVAVNHKLEKGSYDQCHACRMPISEEDKASPVYSKGVSCPHCHDRLSPEQLSRFAERQRQVQLARERNESHIGSSMEDIIERRRREKLEEKNRLRQQTRNA